MSTPPAVVALGGGHGLAATLAALTRVTPHVTAVVTVADDGGSSGRLRTEHGALPPGDLRMALATLAAEDGEGRAWADALQYRLQPGPLAVEGSAPGGLGGHALGNLLLHGLTEMHGDPVVALDQVGRLVGCRGRVLPMATVPLDIVATLDPPDRHGRRQVRGQVAAATARGVTSVRLDPPDPPVCPEALAAVAEADVVVLGPGSWFTSVLPHLLVPELRTALESTAARVVVVLNLAPQQGETQDLSPGDHLDVLARHAPALPVSDVLVDAGTPRETLEPACRRLGARLCVAAVAVDDGTPRHDPERLADALRRILDDRPAGAAASGGGARVPTRRRHHLRVPADPGTATTREMPGGTSAWR